MKLTRNHPKGVGKKKLNFNSHIKNITKTAFYHLKNITRAEPFLSQSNSAFTTSRLGYCNALLSGPPKQAISQRQLT